MSELLTIILVITSLSMFFIDREHKLAVMFFYCMCMRCFQPPAIAGNIFNIPACFFLSEILHIKEIILLLKKDILLYSTVGIIFVTFLLFLNSPHYLSPKGVLKLISSELIWKYFVVVYALICIRNKNSLVPLVNSAMLGMVLLTIIGIVNYVTKQADFVTTALEGAKVDAAMEDLGEIYSRADRFRVQSMFLNAFDYGYICVLSFFLFYYGYSKQIISGLFFSIFSLCSLFGIITCGCRTVLLVFVISMFLYFYISIPSRKRLRLILVMTLLAITAYQVKPIQDTFDNTLSVFQKNSDVSGSSLEMRAIQFASVLYHIEGNYLFGKGKDYFNIDMGWQDGGSDGLVDQDLYGTEGIYLKLLLERGVVGLLSFYLYLASIFVVLYRKKSLDSVTFNFGLIVLVAYFFFTHATGELSSSIPTFLLLGAAIGILQMESQRGDN